MTLAPKAFAVEKLRTLVRHALGDGHLNLKLTAANLGKFVSIALNLT
jgi:hypothetical protein